MPTDPDRFLQMISEANPWWEHPDVPRSLSPPFKRRDFYVIRGKLRDRPIVALSGPRQVGKTTIMYQLIQDLLAQGVPGRHILFVSFDIPSLGIYSADPLNDSIRLFQERILSDPFRDLKQ